MLKRIRNERGFTLVELLVVLAILAILIAVVVPNLAGITGGARGTAAAAELDTVQTAMDSMIASNEGVTVAPLSPAEQLTSVESVRISYIIGVDANGDDVWSTKSATLKLRSRSTGYYTWDNQGLVAQVTYNP